MFFLSDVCEAQFALGKKELFAVKKQLDRGADKRLSKYGRIHKKYINTYPKNRFNNAQNLNQREMYALNTYLDSGYKLMNKEDNYLARYLRNNVDKALRKLPNPETQKKSLIRRMVIDDENLDTFLNRYTPGKQITTKTLTSTSQQSPHVQNKQFGKRFKEDQTSVKFLIKPKQNTRSRYVEDYAKRYTNEGEQLFPSRTGFKTKKVKQTKDGYTINLDEV